MQTCESDQQTRQKSAKLEKKNETCYLPKNTEPNNFFDKFCVSGDMLYSVNIM